MFIQTAVVSATVIVCGLWGCAGALAQEPAEFLMDFVPPSAGPFSDEAIYTGVAGAMESNQGDVGVFVPVRPCVSGACAGERVEFGSAQWVDLRGMVDLLGEPTVFHHQGTQTSLPLSLSDKAGFPVAVLMSGVQNENGTSRTRLVLVDVRPDSAQVLLSVPLAVHEPDGGGFTTIESIVFESDGPGLPLRLVMYQTVIPSPGDEPFMPGPPLEVTFRLVDGAFRSGSSETRQSDATQRVGGLAAWTRRLLGL